MFLWYLRERQTHKRPSTYILDVFLIRSVSIKEGQRICSPSSFVLNLTHPIDENFFDNFNCNIMDAQTEGLLKNLHVLGALSHNDKLLTNDDNFDIYTPSSLRGLVRMFYRENRSENINRVRLCIRQSMRSAEQAYDEALEFKKIIKDSATLYRTHTSTENRYKRLRDGIYRSQRGLENMKKTYPEDALALSKLTLLLEEISDFLVSNPSLTPCDVLCISAWSIYRYIILRHILRAWSLLSKTTALRVCFVPSDVSAVTIYSDAEGLMPYCRPCLFRVSFFVTPFTTESEKCSMNCMNGNERTRWNLDAIASWRVFSPTVVCVGQSTR